MTKKEKHLAAMGIEVWEKREKKPSEIKAMTSDPAATSTVATNTSGISFDVSKLPWADLTQKAWSCTLCDLHQTRTQVVFGVGNPQAKILFIGEAPGANEDLQGEPFVGRGGMLLNAMLSSIGLQRSDVYIANVIKCRPPNNRDPMPQEVQKCTPYLLRQISLIKPKLMVAVGRIAAQFLLHTAESMARLRGENFYFGAEKIPLIVTYHPAYLLRSPREKSKAYQDFLRIKKFAGSL
jgi:uracil-DNA glycosylase